MTLLSMSFAALNPSYTTLNSEGIRAQAPHALLRYPGAIVRLPPDYGRCFGGRGSPVWGNSGRLTRAAAMALQRRNRPFAEPHLPGPTPGVGNQPNRENPELSCDVIRLAGAIPKQGVAGSCAIRPGSLVSLMVT